MSTGTDVEKNSETLTDDDPTEGDPVQSTIGYLRGFRLNGIAAFDLIATGIAAYVLALGVKWLNQYSVRSVTLILFILLIITAIALHVVTGTPTMLNHFLGINTLEEVHAARKKRGEFVE